MTPTERQLVDFPVGIAVLAAILCPLFFVGFRGLPFGPEWLDAAVTFAFLSLPVMVVACMIMRGRALSAGSPTVRRISLGALLGTMILWTLALIGGTLLNLVIM